MSTNRVPMVLTRIDILHIPDLILKLYVLYLNNASYLPYDWQNCTLLSKSNGKDNEFEYNIPIIYTYCRYLNLVEKIRG